MSKANGVHRADGPRAPRVIRLPSPRWLFSPRRGLPLAVVALVGVASVPVDPPFEGAQGGQPASTTQVKTAPPADSLRWYDDAEQRDRGWDRIRQVYAVPLPTVADAPAAPGMGPVAAAASYTGPFAVPTALWAAYTTAAAAMPTSCHLDPRLLAAIGQIESGSLAGRSLDKQHRAVPAVYGPVLDGGPYASIRDTDAGRWDGDRTWDRAVGPMQFIPSTWSRYGRDADGDGVADPQDIEDAALSAAGYLCAGGRDLAQPDGLRSAVLSYNHSNTYLSAVLSLLPGVVPGGADLLFARGYDTTAAAASAPTATAGSAVTGGTPSTSSTTSPTTSASPSTTTRPSSSSTTSSSTTSTTSSTTSSATTSSTMTSSTMTSSTTTSSSSSTSSTSPTTTTTSSSSTTSSSTTSSSTTSSSTTSTPTTTTTTPADCDTSTVTGTATSTATSTTTASSTGSPTASATGDEPTPTGTCSTSPTTTPSAAPSTSSATATEAALLDGASEPTAD